MGSHTTADALLLVLHHVVDDIHHDSEHPFGVLDTQLALASRTFLQAGRCSRLHFGHQSLYDFLGRFFETREEI